MNPAPSVYIFASGVICPVSPKSYAYLPLVMDGQDAGSTAIKVNVVFPLNLVSDKRADQSAEIGSASAHPIITSG
jgi:hypothetical protein